MKIWHISDTHANHQFLTVPKDVDVVIHSGDCSNYKDYHKNYSEVYSFLVWFGNLNVKHKIYVAGNHDMSIEKGYITRDDFKDKGIIYLENEGVTIDGINFWGSPFTPTFGSWAFMKSRDSIGRKVWQHIPDDTNVLITHGMPKGILDLTTERDGRLASVGDKSLLTRIKELPNLKWYLGGHLHNSRGCMSNAGTLTPSGSSVSFSNGSCVIDGRIDRLSYHGNIIEI